MPRSVAEVASTWQGEEKKQRDMLFNRADWDTLPPVKVPSLGGVEYRLGPGAQVPMRRGDTVEALNLNAPAPTVALELVKLLRLQSDEYFGRSNPEIDPSRSGAKQAKAAEDFFEFWTQILLRMYVLTLKYDPMEIVRVTGNPALAQMDPYEALNQYDVGLEFDIRELNPDFMVSKLQAIHGQVLPADAAGVIDRGALTTLELRMLDPRLAQKITQDKTGASQKLFRETSLQVMSMALGNEAEYVENDPTAQMKLQYMQGLVANNPRYQQQLKADPRFAQLLEKYMENLQMSVMQQQNKIVGRIGVKPMPQAQGQMQTNGQ